MAQDVTMLAHVGGWLHRDDTPIEHLSAHIRLVRWHRERGARVVYLPKTFGPLTDTRVIELAKESVDLADLVFARDRPSADVLARLDVDASRLRCAPDYTLDLPLPSVSERWDRVGGSVVVVPSRGLLSSDHPARLTWFQELIDGLRHRGVSPTFLVHQTTLDRSVVDTIGVRDGGSVVVERDPLTARAVLGLAELVVSFRYHAGVGAMLQGVPTLLIGAGPKYGGVMADFGVPDLYHHLDEPWVGWALERFDALRTASADRSRACDAMAAAIPGVRERVQAMWDEVGLMLGR